MSAPPLSGLSPQSRTDQGPWARGTPGPRRNILIVAISIAVVVVTVVAVLQFVVDRSPPQKAGSSPVITGSSYSAVSPGVEEWAASFRGGGWSLLGADGFAIPAALVPGPVNSTAFIVLNGGGSCSYTSLVTANQTFQIPATSGNLSSGNASFWRIDMVAAPNKVLTVVEMGGSIYPLAAGTCADNNQTVSLQAVTPVVVDSSVAASSGWTAGGGAYAANHTRYVVGYGVSAGIQTFGRYFPPQWYIQYATCTPSLPYSTSTGFSSLLNGTTGALVQSEWVTTSCPPVA